MKYCMKCGNSLPDPNPKFCPDCGSRIPAAKAPAAEGKKKEKPEPEKPMDWKGLGKKAAIGIAMLVIFFYVAFGWPGWYYDQADTASQQYFQYMTAFGKDSSWMDFGAKSYNNITLDNYTFQVKAKSADTYAKNAKQALTSWNYTLSFLRSNSGLLNSANISATDAEANITSKVSEVKDEVGKMQSELGGFAVPGGVNESAVQNTLASLKQAELQAAAMK